MTLQDKIKDLGTTWRIVYALENRHFCSSDFLGSDWKIEVQEFYPGDKYYVIFRDDRYLFSEVDKESVINVLHEIFMKENGKVANAKQY